MRVADPIALTAPLRVSVHSWGGAAPPRVRTALGPIAERRGLVVRIEDDRGNAGLGEATPLPALFPKDSLELAHRAVTLAASQPRPASLAPHDVSAWISALPEHARAARFAFESALIDLRAKRRGTTVAAELAPEPQDVVVQTRLVGALSSPDLDLRVSEAMAAGYRSIKVKLGPGDVRDAASNLVRLRTIAKQEVGLRIDCNGSLEPDEFLRIVPALIRAEVEFIEEPCLPATLGEVWNTEVPVFLDETFLANPMHALSIAFIEGIVLKPSLFEAPTTCMRFAGMAANRDLQVVVSHAFEGPVALAMLREIAMALPGERAHGLDDHAALEVFTTAVPKLEPTFTRRPLGEGTGGLQIEDPTPLLAKELAWTA